MHQNLHISVTNTICLSNHLYRIFNTTSRIEATKSLAIASKTPASVIILDYNRSMWLSGREAMARAPVPSGGLGWEGHNTAQAIVYNLDVCNSLRSGLPLDLDHWDFNPYTLGTFRVQRRQCYIIRTRTILPLGFEDTYRNHTYTFSLVFSSYVPTKYILRYKQIVTYVCVWWYLFLAEHQYVWAMKTATKQHNLNANMKK